MKILFVCLGNICRSPLAEAIFNHKIKKLGFSGSFSADSCGTSNYEIGNSPDPRTIKNALLHGIKPTHVARQLRRSDLDEFDWIFAMDRSNEDTMLRLADSPKLKQKVKLIREFDPMGLGDVPDPYGGSEKDFELVFQILDRTIDQLIAELTQ